LKGVLRRVAHVRTDVSKERIASFASIIRIARIGELGITLAVTSKRITLRHPDDGSDIFLRNVGSYKSHTA
jgi:demethoxyubiquinone hydroxylase (CLK1/Coq7/Cat5 family)